MAFSRYSSDARTSFSSLATGSPQKSKIFGTGVAPWLIERTPAHIFGSSSALDSKPVVGSSKRTSSGLKSAELTTSELSVPNGKGRTSVTRSTAGSSSSAVYKAAIIGKLDEMSGKGQEIETSATSKALLATELAERMVKNEREWRIMLFLDKAMDRHRRNSAHHDSFDEWLFENMAREIEETHSVQMLSENGDTETQKPVAETISGSVAQDQQAATQKPQQTMNAKRKHLDLRPGTALAQFYKDSIQHKLVELRLATWNNEDFDKAQDLLERVLKGGTKDSFLQSMRKLLEATANFDIDMADWTRFATWLFDTLPQELKDGKHEINDSFDFFNGKRNRLQLTSEEPIINIGRMESPALKAISNIIGKSRTDSKVAIKVTIASTEQHRFRFLDLPAELRTWVYRHALAPTGKLMPKYRTVQLSDGDQVVVVGVAPSTTPALIGANRQIKSEIGDMFYAENTIYITAENIGATVMPVFSQDNRFTLGTFAKLQHVVLALDMGSRNDSFAYKCLDYKRCDWKQLQYLTGLKDVRICVIKNPETDQDRQEELPKVLKQVIERLPAACEVKFGPRSAREYEHCFRHMKLAERKDGFIIPAEELEEAGKVEGFLEAKGSKNGSTKDHRWDRT